MRLLVLGIVSLTFAIAIPASSMAQDAAEISGRLDEIEDKMVDDPKLRSMMRYAMEQALKNRAAYLQCVESSPANQKHLCEQMNKQKFKVKAGPRGSFRSEQVPVNGQ